MLDVYRFILALCVVQAHLVRWTPMLAEQAVFSFYVLSGFLMTLILNESYGFSPRGLLRFSINRWLRLFPIYYTIIGTTSVYIAFIGLLSQLNEALAIPATPWAAFANLSIVNLASYDYAHLILQRLSPTAWSLAVEIFCYALLALYFAQSQRRLALMLTIGIALATFQILNASNKPDYGLVDRYMVLQAGLIPFALGGLAYFWRNSRFYEYSGVKLSILVTALLANVALTNFVDFHKYVSSLYVAAALNAALVPMMFKRPASMRWQRTLGGIAYPIFLCHWLVGTLLAIYVPALKGYNVAFFAVTVAGSMMFGAMLYFGIDRRIEKIRSRVKAPQAVAPHDAWPMPEMNSAL
jgi:peptidoglycan/LPS O-acetylase OafA/YrhL